MTCSCGTWVEGENTCAGCRRAKLGRRQALLEWLAGDPGRVELASAFVGAFASKPGRRYTGAARFKSFERRCDVCGKSSDTCLTLLGSSGRMACYRCRRARGEKPTYLDRGRVRV